jgi:hypothetical protein
MRTNTAIVLVAVETCVAAAYSSSASNNERRPTVFAAVVKLTSIGCHSKWGAKYVEARSAVHAKRETIRKHEPDRDVRRRFAAVQLLHF